MQPARSESNLHTELWDEIRIKMVLLKQSTFVVPPTNIRWPTGATDVFWFPTIPTNNTWSHFYQTRSAWSVDQGSNKITLLPTISHLLLPNFVSCRRAFKCKILDSRAFPSWSLIHGLRWSGLIKAEPGEARLANGTCTSALHAKSLCLHRPVVRCCLGYKPIFASSVPAL